MNYYQVLIATQWGFFTGQLPVLPGLNQALKQDSECDQTFDSSSLYVLILSKHI